MIDMTDTAAVKTSNHTGKGERRFIQAGYFFCCLFFIVSFLSKAALNSVGALLVLMTLVYTAIYGRRWAKDIEGVHYIVMAVGLGTFFALFSNDGGPVASLEFLNRVKFFVLPLILGAFVRSRKAFYGIVVCVVISAILAALYSVWQGATQYGLFHGAYKLERTAALVLCVSLALVAFLIEGITNVPKQVSVLFFALAFFFHIALVLSGIRGAWVGYGLGAFVILILTRHRLVLSGGLVVVVSLFVLVAGGGTVKNEVVSIFNTKTNASNTARLHLWKVGLDFSKEQFWFGTGVKGVKTQYAEFFERQPDSYQKKYFYANSFHADFHNNFIF